MQSVIYKKETKLLEQSITMAFVNEESANELIQAQAHVWKHTFNFIDSMSLKCAIQLGIFDVIHNHGKPMTLSELVAALPSVDPAKARCIYRLMRVLVHSGFFDLKEDCNNDEEEVVYSLTPASRLLLKDEPFRAKPLLLLNLEPVCLNPWNFLSTWFEKKNAIATPFDMVNGMAFYDHMAHDTNLKNLFYEAMDADSLSITGMMLRECKSAFQGIESLIDVGGGTGTVAKAISNAFPDLKCTVFDLPHVVANLQGTKNLSYVGGDMFEAIPPANAVFLKWILHNWNDEESIKILKRCKEAIPSKDKGGKVIIIDVTIKNQKYDEQSIYGAQVFFDMLMMVKLNGMERTEKEWKKLFLAAGFSDYKITPTLGIRSLIEVYP